MASEPQVQRDPAGRAGEPADEAEQPSAQRLGRDDPRTEADPGGPAGEVMGDDLDRQPRPVGREFAGRQVIERRAVLELPDRVLDLGVAAVVSLELEHLAVAIGDEGVVVVQDEGRELRARRRSYPADDEPDGRREPNFDRWVEIDLDYIDSWSLWLYVRILVRTVPAMVQWR
jgi:hypothetical protein